MKAQEKNILIGSLLGDGSCNSCGGITIAASVKHLDYLILTRRRLRSLNPGPIKSHTRFDPRHKKHYTTARFYIGKQKWARAMFYKGGSKIFPPSIVLTKESFAQWFLDDGCCVNGSGFSIAVQGFSPASQQRAIRALKAFGLVGKLTSDGRIYLGCNAKATVGKIVGRNCPPSMRHKVALRRDLAGARSTLKCPGCGRLFDALKSAGRKFCTRPCADRHRELGYATRRNVFKKCISCGHKFKRYKRTHWICPKCSVNRRVRMRMFNH